jgi:2-polyprenyl-3-methyl-5-hydroxy-6-metoxy-1,4-benzoquinol methylase
MSSETDVDVDELLRRVRQEVEQRRLGARMRDGGALPIADEEVAAAWKAVHEAITAAEPSSAVGMRLPPMSQQQGLRRRVAVPVARLFLRAAQLVTRDQSAFNRLVLELVRMLADTVRDGLAAGAGKIEALTHGLAQALAQIRVVPELVDAGTRTAAELRALRERLEGLDATAGRLEAMLDQLARRADEDRTAARTREDEIERIRAEYVRTLSALETSIGAHVAGLPAGAPAGAGGAAAALGDVLAHRGDAFYVSFEDRFRGSRDDVKRRVRVYLQTIRDAGAGTPERPLLDVGCGRGEWLEVLRDEGLVARGIDLNRTMVVESGARGLDVTEADVLSHLRSLPDASLGAVTGLHVIEHLGFPTVVALFDECVRVLRPGGVVIFETPNPRNLVVGACQFYIDPTHERPLHPDAMAFVAESRGLERVSIVPLHPVENAPAVADDPIATVVHAAFFGPQDYAVVAHRAGA